MRPNVPVFERIKAFAALHKKSLLQIEKEMEISQGTLKNSKNHSASIDTVIRLADYFGVSIDAFIGRTPPSEALLPDEQKLLDLFRSMSATGQAYLMQTAEIAAKNYIKKSAYVSEA